VAGVYFVTRLKDNAVFTEKAEFAIPENQNIRADQLIQLTGVQVQTDCPGPLRRVVVWDAENKCEIVWLTNQFEFGSTTIAAIYKERWKIELFFKALKQNLTVKTFVGTIENALRIQIWPALIALLLLKWLHHLSKANWSLSNLASMLRLNLFTYRDLINWLHESDGNAASGPCRRATDTDPGVIWTGYEHFPSRDLQPILLLP
jgi:IS4 transposase